MESVLFVGFIILLLLGICIAALVGAALLVALIIGVLVSLVTVIMTLQALPELVRDFVAKLLHGDQPAGIQISTGNATSRS